MRKKEDIENIEHHFVLEAFWTITPMILLGIMFYYGYDSLKAMRTVPADNMNVKVTGQMWFWTHEYPNGKKTKDLYVPKDENIRLEITAPVNDVLHSYYVPALRFKQDAVPGQVYTAWFNATETGSFDIECAEYCGTRHAYMLAKVVVLEKDEWDAWYNSDKRTPFDKDEPMAVHPGLALLEGNGCTGCHSLDGSPLVGPSYKDMFGKKVKVLEGGTLKEVIADEAYLKLAIEDPDAQLVEGFAPGMMAPYKDVLTPEQIDTIVDYIKTGGKVEDPAKKAMDILESNGCIGCHSMDGTPLVGPTYKDMFGRKVKVMEGGTLKEVITDETYLKVAIEDPDAQLVEGYSAGMMAPYKDVLKPEEIDLLINYFKTGGKPAVDISKKAVDILEMNGCIGCHSSDGTTLVGPSYKGMYGAKVKVKEGDTLKEVIKDDAYLKTAILEPDAQVIEGFTPGMMAPYKGVISGEDVDLLIEYFKSLK